MVDLGESLPMVGAHPAGAPALVKNRWRPWMQRPLVLKQR